VWWARRQDAGPGLAGLLDETERQRWAGYRRDQDRERFVVGCALAKAVAAGAGYGEHPARIALDRTCPRCGKPHGKPRIRGGDLELSVSHSGDLIAVAAARVTPVGVDVERRRDRPGGQEALERYVLSEDEREAFGGGRAFLVAWTRKEAVTKATGDGLRVSFRDVVVSPPGEPPRLLSWPYPGPPEDVSLFDLDAPDGYAAALAVLGRCDTVTVRDGSALLETTATL